MKDQIVKIIIGLVLVSPFAFSQTQSSEENQALEVINFSLESTDGEMVELSDYKGKFVVIHIATTWCPYCNAEAPYLEEIAKF